VAGQVEARPVDALTALAIALTLDLPAAITRRRQVVRHHRPGYAEQAHVRDHRLRSRTGLGCSALELQPHSPLRVHRAAAAAAVTRMTALFAVMPRVESADFTSTVTGGLAATRVTSPRCAHCTACGATWSPQFPK